MAAAREFRDRVVVITGAGGGIGRALATRFARGGARLGLLDVNPESLAAAEAAQDAERTLAVVCDVTDPEACRRAAAAVIARFGGIDVLVCNAGAVHRSGFLDTELSVFRKVMEVNFHGALNITKACQASLVSRGGLIIVLSSIAGLAPLLGRSGYAASKHALHGLFESARPELAAAGVSLLMVCPSFTRSGFEQAALGPDGRPAGTSRTMIGALAEPEDVANGIFEAARAGRERLVFTGLGRLTAVLSRLAPTTYERLMVRRLGGPGR